MSGSVLSALSLLFGARHGLVEPRGANAKVDDIAFTAMNGECLPLSSFAGQTVIVSNTASKCAFKHHLPALQSLYEEFQVQGVVVLGVPSNDFGDQEPYDDPKIAEIYGSQLNVTFPLTVKTKVRGSAMHPFFSRVQSIAGAHALPKWNFYKYVITPDGHLASWFSTPISPRASVVRNAIKACLEKDKLDPVPG